MTSKMDDDLKNGRLPQKWKVTSKMEDALKMEDDLKMENDLKSGR